MGRPTHLMSRAPEYKAWCNMIARCTYRRSDRFLAYGGRGIRVCPEWLAGFEAFYRDVGPRPGPKHTLDRINVEGHYEPGNVRWATPDIQNANRRDNITVTVNGTTLTVAEWARKTGLNPFTIYARIRKRGWAPEKAVSAPCGPQHGRK